MSGVLIYTDEEAKRNSFAIEKYRSLLDIKVVDEAYNGDADYAINRTNDCRIARRFEDRGTRVFNSYELSRIANDKQLCYDIMDKNGVPIMETRYTGVPFVKKPINSHGGIGVELLNIQEEHAEGFVYQKPCDTLGRDLRVWAIGGEIITSILRESKTDFRSNFCLGGSAIPYTMNGEELKLVKKVIDLANGDYIGVDFLFDNGRLVFNEIEDTVGARMVYAKTDIDIIGLYCEYIKSNI